MGVQKGHFFTSALHSGQTEGRELAGEGLPTGLESSKGSDKEDVTAQDLSSQRLPGRPCGRKASLASEPSSCKLTGELSR